MAFFIFKKERSDEMMYNSQAARTQEPQHASNVNKSSLQGAAARILLGSLTVVEKSNYVSTGKLSYAEGDLIAVELSDYKAFVLGDKVKVIIYSPGGVYVFESILVALDHGSLMILNPPNMQHKFVEKRTSPRIETKEEGIIHSVFDVTSLTDNTLSVPIQFTVTNISMGGVGFNLYAEFNINKLSYIGIELELGFSFSTIVEVLHKETTEFGHYYGARFVELTQEHTSALRAYLLRMQIESHMEHRRKEKLEEALKGE
jgi:c-di-GMP-binding flagellar brake protein YcgR